VKTLNPVKTIFGLWLFLSSAVAIAQSPPPVQWAYRYGGSSYDIPLTIKLTPDGGTIVGGYTESKNGDVANNNIDNEFWDLWIVKLSRCGNIEWQRALGGTNYESARDIIPTSDGGYLVLGETNSSDGDVIAGYGTTKDIWLLKFDAGGNLLWQKRIGGNGMDLGNQIVPAGDGNFLIVATSSSNDGEITGNKSAAGYTDGVLMKIDPLGNVIWTRCFGGTKNEELLDAEIIGGRIYLAGYANSTDGDIPPNQKNYDVWLLAIDGNGNKVFSRIFGGAQNDVAYSMSQGTDGTLTLAGYTTSNDGDVGTGRGSQDYWIINVGSNGNLRWTRLLGGSEAEFANSVITDADGGYLVAGISYSSDGDVTGARGEGDYWVVKLSPAGEPVWNRTYGGSDNDHLRSIVYHPQLNEYYLSGDTESFSGDFSAGRGQTDFGVIKLKLTEISNRDSAVCDPGLALATDTLRDVCGYDSVILTYNAVPLPNPFEGLRNRDTIFTGETITIRAIADGNISWDNDPTLSCVQCNTPIASPLQTTTYTAYNNGDGCTTMDRFEVVVLEDVKISIPNAFTPNGDGVNDVFGVGGKTPADFKMQIYNRYGQVVFISNDRVQTWNGRFQGQLQPNGTFVYTINYTDMRKVPQQRQGTLLLLR
jgi:gliding motility-associated-like protein